MGKYRNGWALNLFGGFAAVAMGVAAIGLVASWL
jgi:hypothetical protein